MATPTIPLPKMDAQIPDLETGGTRANITRDYNRSDDKLVEKILRQAQLFQSVGELLAAGCNTVMMPKLGPLEFATIVYFDCLDDKHPIREQFSREYVEQCLQAARDYHVIKGRSYLGQALERNPAGF